jgi:hypothetical protein
MNATYTNVPRSRCHAIKLSALGRITGSLIALVAGMGMAWPAGSAAEELEHRFEAEGRSARFESRFLVAAGADCVLNNLFAFEHLEACAGGSMTIELVDASESTQIVDFIHDGFLVHSRLRYRRALLKEQGVIEVELISSKIRGLLAPIVEQSSGRYEVRATPRGAEVRYEEQTMFDESPLNFAHTAAARRKAVAFLAAVKSRLDESCPDAAEEVSESARGSQP